MAKKGYISKFLRIIKIALLIFFGSSILFTIIYRFIPPPLTPLMIIRVAGQISEGSEIRLIKDWEPLSRISPNLSQAVVAAEDNEFLEHYGFDFDAIKKAQDYNKKHKRTKGASTISQQTAKNVFLWPQRSWVRKGLEVYFTALIEVLWGKKRIMEVYLNVIEMGDGIYGAEAASRQFFKKPASRLGRSESALIAACLPNPRIYKINKPSSYILRKQSRIMNLMNKIDRVELNKP